MIKQKNCCDSEDRSSLQCDAVFFARLEAACLRNLLLQCSVENFTQRSISAESNLQKNAQKPTKRRTALIYIFIASKEIYSLRVCKIYHTQAYLSRGHT
jgi:hypothetical protein